MTFLHQEARLRHLAQQCDNLRLGEGLDNLTKKELEAIDFVVDDPHRLLLKAVQKTGCTSWRTLMINNARTSRYRLGPFSKSMYHLVGLGLFKECSREEALEKLKTYYSILTVRHPLRRLESFFMKNYITKMLVQGKVTDKSQRSMAAAFQIFIEEFLTATKENRHWRTISGQAYPCMINYRFVGKLIVSY